MSVPLSRKQFAPPKVDARLARALAKDDRAEDRGGHPDDRETCYSCKTWATDEHVNSRGHQVRSGAVDRY